MAVFQRLGEDTHHAPCHIRSIEISRQLLTESHGWHRNIDIRQGGEWSSARDGEEEEDSKGDEGTDSSLTAGFLN
jgi:hypothetical protein